MSKRNLKKRMRILADENPPDFFGGHAYWRANFLVIFGKVVTLISERRSADFTDLPILPTCRLAEILGLAVASPSDHTLHSNFSKPLDLLVRDLCRAEVLL
ncbi:MAG: hypothetical protein NZ937_06635 [Armatimonadetes bacterium]|nr:hypothetical protein [Armatimonadota bacterium]